MGVDGVGYAEVAFGVFEVDGVHLVGHCGGAYFAGLDFLLEVFHADIHPHVAVKVEDDCVDAAQGVEHGCDVVVV